MNYVYSVIVNMYSDLVKGFLSGVQLPKMKKDIWLCLFRKIRKRMSGEERFM